MQNTPAYKLARGLGWFSLALGAAEIAAPGMISRTLGMRERNGLVRLFGLRELGAGAGILLQSNPTPWMWARVAGDTLDLAALLLGLDRRNPRRGSATAAFVSVAAISLVDYLCARDLSAQVENRRIPRRDYSERSGITQKPTHLRAVRTGAR
jgi:hypothetical protein